MSRPFGPPSSTLRSPQFSNIRGAILSDSRIAHYARLGYYGSERQAQQRQADLLRRAGRTKIPSALDAAMAVLNDALP